MSKIELKKFRERLALQEQATELLPYLIDDTVESDSSLYSSSKIEGLTDSASGMRGNAVFVSIAEPENPEVNDIWIKI